MFQTLRRAEGLVEGTVFAPDDAGARPAGSAGGHAREGRDTELPSEGVPGDGAPGDGAIVTPKQVRYLKISIAIMTAMLAIGIPVLIGRIIYLARGGAAQAPATAGMSSVGPAAGVAGLGSGGAAADLMAKARMLLPAGASVRSLSLSGQRLAVHHAGAAEGEGILILDLVTGTVVSRVAIARE